MSVHTLNVILFLFLCHIIYFTEDIKKCVKCSLIFLVNLYIIHFSCTHF